MLTITFVPVVGSPKISAIEIKLWDLLQSIKHTLYLVAHIL
jgi:hypothetical protein